VNRLVPPAPGVLGAREFEARYQELEGKLAERRDNERCVECDGCFGCQASTFCRDSDRLCRCHYCIRCVLCTDSSHCRDSRTLVACNHCIQCEGSVRCSYVVRSVALSDCTYCFGCVGISGKDFYVLNEPYDRSTYFDVTRRLLQELGIVER